MEKILHRLREGLYSSERPLEERMFFLGSIVAFATLFALLIISAGTNQGTPVMLAITAMLTVLLLVFLFVLRTRNTAVGGVVLSLVVGLVIFPAGYILGGGAYSGAPVWFVIAIAFMATIFRSNYFWVYVVIATVAFGVSTYVGYRFPEIIVPLQGENYIYFDTFFATATVAILVSILLRYTGRIYKAESELAEKQKEEIQALSDAQSRFFSSMSHEIRTPLNTIIGLNEMTLRDTQISEEVAENAANIQNASRMLLSLINDVLDISKIESGRMELSESQYETSRMLSDVVNLLWARAKEKGLRFEVNVGEAIPSMLYGDEMRLKQVIVNVLTNAIKYTEQGGVTLTVDGEQSGPNEFMLRVDVDDTGVGIRKEAIPYLFDSFKRVDTDRNRNVEGTGLGLAISKQLVDLMGGTITVDSIFTKGSHFQIEVPQRIVNAEPMRYTSVAARRYETSAYESSFEAPDAHVLIVDDNDMNRMVSRKLLRGTRVQVDVAGSGREALEKTALVRYDVIFMDHEMPDMDGIETLKAVREQQGGLCRSTPVVALTANAGSDMNAFYIKQGFQAYLAKPIHGSLLEATLLQFLPAELIERTAEVGEGESISVAMSRHKKAYAITVDCPCDVPESMLEQAGIVRMPIYIITSAGRFRDVEEIDSDNLFSYLDDGGESQTQPASVEEYEQFFGNVLTTAETVIHLSISSKVSSSYDIACEAAASFGNVHVVDTYQFSSGLGLVALRAAKMIELESSVDAVIADLDQYSRKVVSTVLVSSQDSPIIKIGMPGPLRFLVSAFSWEPVLHLKRRGLKLVGFHAGYVTEASDKYIKSAMRKARRHANRDILFVTCSGCSLQEQKDILAAVEKEAHGLFEQIVLQKASATVAANTWMHSFGIMYAKQ